MLLNKHASLRSSASELLDLSELRDRIIKFTQVSPKGRKLEEERKVEIPKGDHFSAYREAIAKKQIQLKL